MIKSLSSYIIPLKRTEFGVKAMILRYQDGYGPIGGRLESGEDCLSSLQREVKEELGSDCKLFNYTWKELNQKYSFDITNKLSRKRGNATVEEQTYFYVWLDEEVKLDFIEEGKTARVVEVDLSSLYSLNYFPYESFIKFAKENLNEEKLT